MSVPNEEAPPSSSHAQVLFEELVESVVVDVACECHRIARLGLDRNLEEEEEELRLSAQARARVADPSNSSSEGNNKYVVDIFGQTHPPVATDIFECINCGRSIVAGRFAPHLEKCMGKGRKARLKAVATRSSSNAAAQNRYTRNSPVSSSTTTSTSNNRLSSDYSNGSSFHFE